MHELAITQSIVEMLEEQLPGGRITMVRLEIGKLSGIVPDSVRFCFDVVIAGTRLQGAQLEILEPAGEGRCRTCGDDLRLEDFIILCPCGSADVAVSGGDQLRIRAAQVREDPVIPDATAGPLGTAEMR